VAAWTEVTSGRRRLEFVPPDRWSANETFPFVDLAARTGLSTTGGDPARLDFGAQYHARQAMMEALEHGTADPQSLFIVHAEDLEEFARRPGIVCREIERTHVCHRRELTSGPAADASPAGGKY
jgi:hypothetical protein